LEECRQRACHLEGKPRNWTAAAIIVTIWLALTLAAIYWLARCGSAGQTETLPGVENIS